MQKNNHDLAMCCGTTCNKFQNKQYVEQLEQQNRELLHELADMQYEFRGCKATINLDGFDYKVDLKVAEAFNVQQKLIERLQKQIDDGMVDYE